MFSPTAIPKFLAVAWLLPLLGFAVEIFAGRWQRDRKDRTAAGLAVACIATGFVCSALALFTWGIHTGWAALAPSTHGDGHHGESHSAAHDAGHDEHAKADDHHHDAAHAKADSNDEAHAEHEITGPLTGTFYTLARFGSLQLSIDFYIDSLTLVMFTMVTFIATCIHLFATGYMSEELTDDYVDHQVHTRNGGHFHRPGRFYRFFAFLSLFCFSMLGLVIAGNIFMVFVFWELVGVCSYFLIGFYVERKSASTAANKAFIMNRVGDFGFLIGLMVLWTYFGTFSFGDYNPESTGYGIASGLKVEAPHEGEEAAPTVATGLFGMARGSDGQLRIDQDVDGVATVVMTQADDTDLLDADGNHRMIPYVLLTIAGLGIFAGCIGKSAQFPLQTWLPDAMEGPTPVSALVHSATMVAAGVYLAARFYPMFTHEVLLTIAYIGCVTAFVAATIAIVATDIKKVLAYSTISQRGYMMLGIGVGGWGAGLFHLITHAFFKSLMFLASGSVIYGCHHEQEMPKMGGLWRKMPITAFTMLAGVIAIAGLAIPGTPIAFSGFHSKDAIVANALAFTYANPSHFLLFVVPLVTAGITAFYMFRLWFYTFAGKPRDHHVYDHCHESPRVMTTPLIVLAVLAAGCAIGGEEGPLYKLITFSQPAGVDAMDPPPAVAQTTLPGHEAVHAVHSQAGMYALIAAFLGTGIAWLVYGKGVLDPADVKRQLSSLHTFLSEKWQFDTLYDVMFVRPVHVVSSWCTAFDRVVIDGFLHFLSRLTVKVAHIDRRFDEGVVDGFVNLMADSTYSVGRSFRVLQTGKLRQYVMFIAVSVVFLFVLVFAFFPRGSSTSAPEADVKVSSRVVPRPEVNRD